MSILLSMLGGGDRPSLSQLEAAFSAEIRRCDEYLQREEVTGITYAAFQRQREAAARLLHAIVPAQQGLPL